MGENYKDNRYNQSGFAVQLPGNAIGQGDNIITVTAVDAADNSSQKTITVTYTKPDTTSPEILISDPVSGGATYTSEDGNVSLSGTASDNVRLEEVTWRNSRGGSGTASGTTNWSVSGIELDAGENIITVAARDEAGNVAAQSITIVYNPADTTPPVITRTKPTSWAYYFTRRRAMNLAGTTTDSGGIEKVEWRTSTGQSGIAEGTTEWIVTGIKLSGGWNTITVTATDEEGNQAVNKLSVICWSY